MRTSRSRFAATIVVGLLVAACASTATPAPRTAPSPPAPASAAAAPISTPAATPAPTDAPTASPSLEPLAPSASLPVRGSGKDIGGQVQIAPGPAGGLYVLIPTERRSVVALLDSTGKPRPGWPIGLDAEECQLPDPAPDGSIRVVCRRYPDSVSPAFALTPDGRPIAGWPVELPASASARVVDGDLYTLIYVDDNADRVITGLRLVVVAPDGTPRTGTTIETPDRAKQDWQPQLGPDGTGYLLTYPNEPADTTTQETEITAFDLGGVRGDWLARVTGWPSKLAFGPDGRIYATAGREGKTSRILVFGQDGRPLPIGSDALPVAATSEYVGAGPFGGPPPPVVAEDGTTFLVSEQGGTTVYRLDASGHVMAGWPYRDPVGLQWSYVAPGEVGTSSWRSEPAVGPDAVLYLLHPPRTANLGGSIVAIGRDGRVRPGWPVELKKPGSEFWSVVVGSDGTVYALAIEPGGGDSSSASLLAIEPDSTVLWTTTIIEP